MQNIRVFHSSTLDEIFVLQGFQTWMVIEGNLVKLPEGTSVCYLTDREVASFKRMYSAGWRGEA